MGLRAAHLVVPSGASGDDRAEVLEVDGALVIAIADGAGGTGGGALAAETVVATTRRRAAELVSGALHAQQLLEEVDADLSIRGGETTAVVVVIGPSGLRGASVGDSEAWLVTERQVVALTKHQQRKPLLGSRTAIVTPFFAHALDGTLLLGTDGLFKYARRDAIVLAARTASLAEAPARLIDLARLRGGGLQDDVAVVIARVT